MRDLARNFLERMAQNGSGFAGAKRHVLVLGEGWNIRQRGCEYMLTQRRGWMPRGSSAEMLPARHGIRSKNTFNANVYAPPKRQEISSNLPKRG
jgi:hypothetical protein